MTFFKKFKYEFLVLAFFVLVRIPELGHDTFNTDVWKWKVRSYDFGTGVFNLQPEKTLQKYHPGVSLTWIGAIAIKFNNLISDQYFLQTTDLQKIFLLHFIQKLITVLALGLVWVSIFKVVRRLFSVKFALFSFFFITLEPFYFAHTREFHLEALLSTFMLASALHLYEYIQDKKRLKSLLYAGVFAGLSILTKTSAIYLVLFSGLILLLELLKSKMFMSEIKWFIKWLLIVVVTFFVLWPAMWVIPGHVISELVRGVREIGVDTEHIQFYFGKMVEDPGPTFYPVVFALRSSAFLFIGFIAFLFYRKKLDQKYNEFSKYLLLYSLFFIIEITIPTKKLDRYILPSLVSISMIVSIFWFEVLEKIKFYQVSKYVAFFIPIVVTLFVIHPIYLSYYNPLFGGLSKGLNVLEPKWMIGQPEILRYFQDEMKTKKYTYSGQDQSFEEVIYRKGNENVLSVGFQEKYYTQIWPFFREIGAWAVIQDLTPFAKHTKYFVYPVWNDTGKLENRFQLQRIDDIKLRGVPVYRVYERIL